MFGRLLSIPLRLINAPLRATENVLDTPDDERILSVPLTELANEVEQAADGDIANN